MLREYVTRVRSKGFIIGTLMFPFILVVIFGGYFIFRSFFGDTSKTYYVVDQTGMVYEQFVDLLPDTLDSGEPKFIFTEQKVAARDIDSEVERFQQLVFNKEIDGYMIIPADLLESRTVRYSALSVGNFEEQMDLASALSRIVTNFLLEEKGLSPDDIRDTMRNGRVRIESLQITEEGEVEKSGAASFALTYILTYVLLLMMMIYGTMVMRSVIEEKSQRITETIISSVKPIELMVGKIVGICSLGVTQLIVMGLFILLAVQYGETIFMRFGVREPEILEVIRSITFTGQVFLFLILFFLMGFIFYASFYAAVGAIVNTEDEGQQFVIPLVFVVMIGYFMMFSVAQNPDTTMAYWASLVPFFTPIVMFARIAVTDPILPDGAIISVFTMAASTIFVMYFVAKIYRVGILMYGKKPSVKELIKWMRYS